MSDRTTRPQRLILLRSAAWTLLVAVVACDRSDPPPSAPTQVVVAEVLSKRVTDWDEYSGRFAAVDSVEVRPRASGYIDEVKFREGQLVKKGDVLVTIDPRPYQADLRSRTRRRRARASRNSSSRISRRSAREN